MMRISTGPRGVAQDPCKFFSPNMIYRISNLVYFILHIFYYMLFLLYCKMRLALGSRKSHGQSDTWMLGVGVLEIRAQKPYYLGSVLGAPKFQKLPLPRELCSAARMQRMFAFFGATGGSWTDKHKCFCQGHFLTLTLHA